MTTQDGWVILKSSDKMWSSGAANGKSLQYSFCENSMNSMKRQNNITLEDEPSQVRKCPICYWGKGKMSPPRSENVQYATGEMERTIMIIITPERMKWLDQNENDTQL